MVVPRALREPRPARAPRARRAFVAATALAGALAVAGCGPKGGDSGSADTHPTVPVGLARLEERSVREVVKATGQWRTSDSVTVSAPFKAYVEALGPRTGDWVARGDAIGTLVTYESRAALRGAEILVRQARSTAERDEASRALRLAERDLIRVPLVASTNGTVLRRAVEPGSEVPEGGELLTIVPVGSVVFEAHVPRPEAARVSSGQKADIGMEGGGTVAATVQRKLPQTNGADQTALFWLGPSVRAPFGAIGRFGNATIVTGAVHWAVLVPDSALVQDDLTGDLRIARVLPDSVAVWTTVRLGPGQEGWHELLEPALPAGTPVVIRGQRGLPDSTHVTAGP